MSIDPRMITDRRLRDQRHDLMVTIGLDPFSQPANLWLELAVTAEERGQAALQRDYERVMHIANDAEQFLASAIRSHS